jgi:hypothetical protein
MTRQSSQRRSSDRRLDSLLALAEAQFHSGLYKQSGTTYGDAASLARGSPDWEKRLKAELGVVEADRVAGYWFRALRTIARLSKTLPQRVKNLLWSRLTRLSTEAGSTYNTAKCWQANFRFLFQKFTPAPFRRYLRTKVISTLDTLSRS